MPKNTTESYQYYPIIIEDAYPLTRDELYEKLKRENITTRKYFLPACHDYECYKGNSIVSFMDLSVTDTLKHKVLCLPFYGNLSIEEQKQICEVILNA